MTMEIEEKPVNVEVGIEEAFFAKTDAIDLCRLCANTDNQLIPIYKGEGLEHHISVKIEKHLPIIKVTEVDKLPLQICYQCASTLISWHNLYEGCLVADKKLREILAIEDDKLCQEDENSTGIPVSSETKAFNETDLDGSDERYAKRILPPLRTLSSLLPMPSSPAMLPPSTTSPLLSSLLARQTEHDGSVNGPADSTLKDTQHDGDSLKCYFCPMVFVTKADIAQHLGSSHATEAFAAKGDTSNGGSTSDSIPISNTSGNVSAKREDEKENYVDDDDGNNDDGDYDAANLDNGNEDKPRAKKSSSGRAETKKKSTGEFSCQQCAKTFETKSGYGRHMNSAHAPDGQFSCDICHKNFSSQTVLKRHNSNVHRTKRTKVPEGEDPFAKWYVFADGQKHLKCDQCKYNSLWYHKGRFLEHYRIHTGEKPFTCDSCGKQFRTKTLLQKHIMFVHEGIKEHPCDICGRCFSDKRYMEDHRRIHTGERPYVCDLCGKTFKQSASLFIHKELHKGLRKHACDMCGKRFTTRSSLTIHIKRHIGERNFICATCGKAFVDGKHLKDHMAVHSDERPFSCELCGGKFKLMKHLKQHGRTHKREYVVS